MNTNDVNVGSTVAVKVGKNEITAELIKVLEDGFKVKSTKTQKEFKVREIIKIVEDTPLPKKKLSLFNAAVEVLKLNAEPLNTREIIKFAIDNELWIPTNSKTPEQTLYGAIFREIATKENPRIVKSEQKGKFKYNNQ